MTVKEMGQIKVGDKVLTGCCGLEVTGTVIEVNEYGFKVSHKPVKWGNDTYTETFVKESTPLQKMFYSGTTPYAEKINR